jgi:SNF2 family DNA or RNA helicase
MIASTLTQFKDGKIKCLLMNTIQMGAGLNITEATHVILLHSMTHEEEKQILGRAYRVGRTKELYFIKLVYPDEQ